MAEGDIKNTNGKNGNGREEKNGRILDGYKLYLGILALIAMGSYPFILHVLLSSYGRDVDQSNQLARLETKIEYFNLRIAAVETEQKVFRVMLAEFGAQMEEHERRLQRNEVKVRDIEGGPLRAYMGMSTK
jgi:hypothetical protein